MKLFLKIFGAVLALFIILIIALNLYLTDERLKGMILPQVEEATGAQISAESMSVTFFRTFPRFGVSIEKLDMLTPDGQPVFRTDELIAAAELFPLFRNEVSILSLSAVNPILHYTVYADSTTNIDFLLEETDQPETQQEDAFSVSIPEFAVRNGSVFYVDETSETDITMQELDANIELFYSDIIENSTDIHLGSLSVSMGGASWISDLALSLNQTSQLNTETEHLELSEGIFSIRGLALNIAGNFSEWSSGAPQINLQFSSASDNFGELLGLAPPTYQEYIDGLQTRGSLHIDGSVSGRLAEDIYPDFDLEIAVADGFLQNPGLPEAIQDIHFELLLNNDLATINNFRANAGANTIFATGLIERPLDEDGEFSLELNGDIDLATVSSFYPIEDLGIENLSGALTTDATAMGRMDQPENAVFSGIFHLTDGHLKYQDVPRAIEQINAIVNASQDRIDIQESGFVAADNRLRLSGSVINPLDENNRTVDITSGLFFDLASIPQFYPIDEDTLSLRGELTANIVLRGTADPDQLETLLQESTAELKDGYISHQSFTYPIEDVSFLAEASGRRIAVERAAFTSGENSLSMNGTIDNYLSDNPEVNLTFNGDAVFSSITNYYSLDPWIQELSGNASMNLNTRGPVNDIQQLLFNGTLSVEDVSASGDSLFLPVSDLFADMSITPNAMQLQSFQMQFGETDVQLSGTLNQYMSFLADHNPSQNLPSITGNYSSSFLNLDEMIDWDEESADDEPVPIYLPNLTASVDAGIERLLVFAIPITNISGTGTLSPTLIRVENASAHMFDGTATGQLDWNVPEPLRTNLHFQGTLDSLHAESFFRDTGFLGPESTLHNYISGSFSSEIDYQTGLSYNAAPDITTTTAQGTFSMSQVRLQGHPIQERLAEFLNTPELASMALDAWDAEFSIQDTVMNIQNLALTSGNLGLELEGTLHMLNDNINYKATLLLPEHFKSGIASVISNRAADALQLEDGRMTVPIRITGTTTSPQIRPDGDIIEEILQDAVRDGASRLIDRLFGN